MKTQNIKIEINKHLSQINGRILRLKDQFSKEPKNTELGEVISDLESRRERIIHLYNTINSLKTESIQKRRELEASIFQSIESFNLAFQEAGGIIQPGRIGKKRHHIDFNNPGNTR